MTDQLIKLPAEQLLTKFGSGGHKPGSGSAAALLGLVACKLIQTVVTLSAGRDEYQGIVPQLTLANQDILQGLEPVLVKAIQDDADQFDRVIKARRLRDKTTDKAERKQLAERALEQLRLATDIPIEIARVCLQVAEKGFIMFDLGFRSARGDSGVAVSSALAGASGALSVVYLNLTSFKGSEWAVRTRKIADELFQQSQALQIRLFERIELLRAQVLARES